MQEEKKLDKKERKELNEKKSYKEQLEWIREELLTLGLENPKISMDTIGNFRLHKEIQCYTEGNFWDFILERFEHRVEEKEKIQQAKQRYLNIKGVVGLITITLLKIKIKKGELCVEFDIANQVLVSEYLTTENLEKRIRIIKEEYPSLIKRIELQTVFSKDYPYKSLDIQTQTYLENEKKKFDDFKKVIVDEIYIILREATDRFWETNKRNGELE